MTSRVSSEHSPQQSLDRRPRSHASTPNISADYVNKAICDLWYDAESVGADLVVETWISPGPRASDEWFDPQPGDWMLVGDDEEPPCRARVTRRNVNHVWVQLEFGLVAGAGTGAASEQH